MADPKSPRKLPSPDDDELAPDELSMDELTIDELDSTAGGSLYTNFNCPCGDVVRNDP